MGQAKMFMRINCIDTDIFRNPEVGAAIQKFNQNPLGIRQMIFENMQNLLRSYLNVK
jgi:hypothetical protein